MAKFSFAELADFSVSASAEQRAEAARELYLYLPHQEAVACLNQLLGDEDWLVRRAAVDSFLIAQPGQWISVLLNCLYDEENAGRRNAAITILSQLGFQILPYIAPHLESAPADVRMFLIQILGELKDRTYLQDIRDAVNEKDPNLVSAAFVALGQIGDVRAIPTILQTLESGDEWLRFQAIEAAGQLRDPLALPVLLRLREEPSFRKAIIAVLPKFHHEDSYKTLIDEICLDASNEKAIASLIELYDVPQPSALQQKDRAAIRKEWNARLDLRTISALLDQFSGYNMQTQKQIIKLLGWSQNREALEFVAKTIGNVSLEEAALLTLREAGPAAVQVLLNRLEEVREEETIIPILELLNELTQKHHTPANQLEILQRFLQDDQPEIRYGAYLLIKQCSSATHELIDGIFDAYEPVHELCLSESLRTVKDNENGIKSALEKRNSELPWERAAAIEVLAHYRMTEADLLQGSRDPEAIVRQRCVQVMSSIGLPEYERTLISALADENAKVRELAARGLSSYRTAETHEALLSLLNDEQIWVRIAAYHSLAEVDKASAATVLAERLQIEAPPAQASILECLGSDARSNKIILLYTQSPDPEVRRAACGAAFWSRDPAVVSRLHSLLEQDPAWSVRLAAVQALMRIKPDRLEETFIGRLSVERDAMVIREILKHLPTLPLAAIPTDVYPLLAMRETMDAAFEFFRSQKEQSFDALRAAADEQSPEIRRILLALLQE